MIKANDPNLKSWINVPKKSDFPIQNIPFGVFKTATLTPRVATIIGDTVIDLSTLFQLGYFKQLNLSKNIFDSLFLNDFIALGQPMWRAVRDHISNLFEEKNPEIKNNIELHSKIFFSVESVELLMPVKVGDYTDFYSSIDHATNVGTMFRDPANALLPNWKHLPVGYHGRASSIVISGTDIYRPKGQTKAPDAELPSFGPTKLLDFELEMAFVIGKSTKMGESVTTENADEHIFGMVIFNDWSARDIQTWEYVPLGPFLAKNFASSISPWIVTLDALEPFRVEGYKQEPKVLPYLQSEGKNNIDIQLEVFIQPEKSTPTLVSTSNYKFMYWNMNQQLAHHTINGCNINIGDLMASGTISGTTPNSYGSMLEITWKGTKPVKMEDGTERKFINDGDSVIMKAHSEKDGIRVGFGEVLGKILPSK